MTSVAGSVVGDVTSVVGGVTSVVGSVVSDVTAGAGSIVDGVTSVLGSDLGGVVGGLTSVVGGAVSEATAAAGGAASVATAVVGGAASVATAVVGGAESAVGGVLSGVGGALGLRERDEGASCSSFSCARRCRADSAIPSLAVFAAQYVPVTPTATTQPVTTTYGSSTRTEAPQVVTPTAAPARRPLRPEDSLQIAGYMGGIDPQHLAQLLVKHGVTIGEDIEVYRERKHEMARRDVERRTEERMRRKRALDA